MNVPDTFRELAGTKAVAIVPRAGFIRSGNLSQLVLVLGDPKVRVGNSHNARASVDNMMQMMRLRSCLWLHSQCSCRTGDSTPFIYTILDSAMTSRGVPVEWPKPIADIVLRSTAVFSSPNMLDMELGISTALGAEARRGDLI